MDDFAQIAAVHSRVDFPINSSDMSSMTTALPNNDSYGNHSGPYDYACWLLDDPPPVMLSHKIYLYSSLVFMALGLMGNVLSMMVFSAKEMRVVSSNVYLLVLAISDSLYLLSVFLSKNLTYIRCFFFINSTLDIYNRSAFFCKSLQYLNDLFSSYSTCVIMAFTVERYVAVYLPIKFKEACTVWRARLFCFIIFIVIAIFISPYHMLYMNRYEQFNVCTVLVSSEKTFTILYGIEAFIFRIVPVFIITVLNIFIILRVTRVTKQSRRRKSSYSISNNNRQSKKGHGRKDDRFFQLTVMLILVSTSYVLTYIPVLVHFIMWKLQRSSLIDFSHDNMLIARNYTCALYIAGFAINFFLYTMSGRVFREQLEVLLCSSSKSSKVNGMRHAGYTGIVITAQTDV